MKFFVWFLKQDQKFLDARTQPCQKNLRDHQRMSVFPIRMYNVCECSAEGSAKLHLHYDVICLRLS